MKEIIAENERIDEIGFGKLKLIQKPEEFCYGVDAVILADFASRHSSCQNPSRLSEAEKVTAFDLGTGTGIIPLILSSKTVWKNIYGLEVQEGSYKRAIRNIELNKESLESGRLHFLNSDVKDYLNWGKEFASSVDVVTSNPPYTENGMGLKNDNSPKHIARHETTAGLEDFIKCSAYLLKPHGDLFMVHRPSRLVDLCYFGRMYGLEPKEIQFVSPKSDSSPNILLIHFVRGGGKQLTLLNTLYVHNEDGSYTNELKSCYE